MTYVKMTYVKMTYVKMTYVKMTYVKMTYVKTMIVIAALTLLAAFTVSAQTYTLVKIKKPVTSTIETRWPQVSIRETLEYLHDRDGLDTSVPASHDEDDRDDRHRQEKNRPVW